MAVTGQTVLVLRALGLGDLLTAVPALRGLRRAYLDSRIVLAAPRALADLLPVIPAVDRVLPTADLSSFAWRQRTPEVAVNLHGSGPQSIEAICSAGAPTVLTHAHPAYPDLKGPQWNDELHEVDRWCRLVRYHGVDADPGDLLLPHPRTRASRPGAVLIHPGASHAARRWPPERFAELARWLAGSGNRVLITGNRAERPLARQVADRAGLPNNAVVAGATGLPQLAALVAEAKLVVCGDTGIAHLATAYATPSVVLFGPVAPRHWGPPDKPQHAALWAGSTGDPFADRPDPGLLRLSVDLVTDAAATVLDNAALARAGSRSC